MPQGTGFQSALCKSLLRAQHQFVRLCKPSRESFVLMKIQAKCPPEDSHNNAWPNAYLFTFLKAINSVSLQRPIILKLIFAVLSNLLNFKAALPKVSLESFHNSKHLVFIRLYRTQTLSFHHHQKFCKDS